MTRRGRARTLAWALGGGAAAAYVVEVALRYDSTKYGRLVLARWRGDIEYTAHDRAVLQQSADSVGEALALAAHLGFKPLSKAN